MARQLVKWASEHPKPHNFHQSICAQQPNCSAGGTWQDLQVFSLGGHHFQVVGHRY